MRNDRQAHILVAGLLLCGSTLAHAAPLAAQSFDGTVFAGGALVTSDLSDEFSVDTGNGVETAKQFHDSGLALGAHLGVRWTALSLEGTVALVPTNLVTDFESTQDITTDQTILVLGGSVLYNFAPSRFFELFLAAGAGIKSYSAEDPGGGFEGGSDPMFNVGGGGRIFLTPTVAIRADVRDYISTFDAFEALPEADQDAKSQHDILLTLGLSYRPGG